MEPAELDKFATQIASALTGPLEQVGALLAREIDGVISRVDQLDAEHARLVASVASLERVVADRTDHLA